MRKRLQDLTIKDAFMFGGSDVECRAVPPPARIGTGNENSGSKCCG